MVGDDCAATWGEIIGVVQRRFGFPILMGTRWVLLAGFGGLLLLLAGLGFSSIFVLDKVERVDRDETGRFIAHAGQMRELRDRFTVAFSGTRNYLLDRERGGVDSRRGQLEGAWRDVGATVALLRKAPLAGQQESLGRVADQVAEYREVVEGTYARDQRWLDDQGYDILSKQLDPLRGRILAALDEVLRVDEEHLRGEFDESTEEIALLKSRLRRTIAVALFLGLALAAFSIWQVVRLERVAQVRYQALTEAYDEQGRLAQRILEVQEQERKNLSRELHDEVSQSLGAMLMDLSALNLDAAKRVGNEVLNSIRNICLLLRPSMLDDLGLIAALHWQARETLRRAGIRVTVSADDADMELPDAHRTTVYRIVQEALQNVVRHSGAEHVQIVIRREGSRLSVRVQDDGKGFDPAVTKGLGLLGMQERVNGLEGTLQIVSEPGKGTILSFLLPLEVPVGAVA